MSLNISKIESVVEACLFASGEALTIDKLSEITEVDLVKLKDIIKK